MQQPRHEVPSCFGSGKTRSMALTVTYFGAVYRPGTAVVMPIAPRWRQVARQILPKIQGVTTRADHFGSVDTAQRKVSTVSGHAGQRPDQKFPAPGEDLTWPYVF
ncbi:hypothetical protein [Micromonospora sp. RTP1Z1]|uniref:hypothetical protein n=1 Tax=Micromonospora sp. RTP1Z1 TaxID=2994043 RepID=UPI0029C8E56F|nr:hypothetical protein [Micromonospora sp. RTP1Z1]